MKQNITEQLADSIAKDFMQTMNPDRWNGLTEQPDSVNTATYEDDNIININNIKCHIEIVIVTDTEATWNHKPSVYVDLVTETNDSVAMTECSTMSSTAMISKMIQYVCNKSDFALKKNIS